ncbi:MAG TPA: ABC transporter permease [Euzebyales bacterium]
MSFIEYLTAPGTIDVLIEQSLEHIWLVVVPIVLATIIAMVLGIIAHRSSLLRGPIMNTTSLILTIPSLALFAALIPYLGIGNRPVIVALTGYALLPIARNTLAGLQSVDPAMIESARGMGMGNAQRLLQMELPVAWPVILTGIRVATQLTVGIAAVAALIGGGGLGNEIYNGIRRIGSVGATESIFGGTLAILILALLFDALYQVIGRLTTSKGLQ